MEYQKMIKLLHGITNQPSKFRTRNWVKINDESKRRYDNSNIRFKTSMIRSNGGDYNDAYILVKGTITVPKKAVAPPQWNSPCRSEGTYPLRSFTRVRQLGELNWASQLKPSGQQISSNIMSRPK